MSSNNPIFSDPSIIQVSEDQSASNNSHSSAASFLLKPSSSSALEPGSALSKLLDSAMANAAKESTPELEPRSSTNSPTIKSPLSSAAFYKFKNPNLIYSVDFLLSIKESPLVQNYDNSPELPDKSFWRLRAKAPSRNEKDFANLNIRNGHHHNANANHNNNHSKNSNSRRQNNNNNPKSFGWDKKGTGFVKNNDLDSLSNDKISQLLGEAVDEVEPEWESADLANDELKMNMGQTVEDFESWKAHMRLEDKKKHGDTEESIEHQTENQPRGNEVDNFFSFVKPKTEHSNETSKSSRNTSVSTPSGTNLEAAGKSSRFSSFFNTPSSNDLPQNTNKESQQSPASHHQKQQLSGGASRFFSPAVQPQTTSPAQVPISQSSQLPSQGPPIPGFGFPSQNPPPITNGYQSAPQTVTPNALFSGGGKTGGGSVNDSFFLSLLNKKESNNSSQAGTPQAAPSNLLSSIQNKSLSNQSVPTASASPNVSSNSTPIQHQSVLKTQSVSIGQPQQSPIIESQQPQQRHSQISDRTQGHPIPPPWFNQFQNGPPGPNGLPMPPPANSQQQQKAGDIVGPPPGIMGPPPHLQYPPGPPPPGMFPPGFAPPQGMQPIPGHFPQPVNGRNGPPFPPPQFFGFPPGMNGMPPSGNIPPRHLTAQPQQHHPQSQSQQQQPQQPQQQQPQQQQSHSQSQQR